MDSRAHVRCSEVAMMLCVDPDPEQRAATVEALAAPRSVG